MSQERSEQPTAGRGEEECIGAGIEGEKPQTHGSTAHGNSRPNQAPAPPRLSRDSQFRISEMKTARPRIPSPFDTAGIVARDHGRPATRRTTRTSTAAARSPRGALQAAATAAASAARRRRDGSRAPAGAGRAALWRHLPRGSDGAAGPPLPPLLRRAGALSPPPPGIPAGALGKLRPRSGGCMEAGPRDRQRSCWYAILGHHHQEKRAQADVRGSRQAILPCEGSAGRLQPLDLRVN